MIRLYLNNDNKRVKLTIKQELIFDKMKPRTWQSAYDLQCSLATLNALWKKGLLERKDCIGSYFFPRNNIVFRRVIRT